MQSFFSAPKETEAARHAISSLRTGRKTSYKNSYTETAGGAMTMNRIDCSSSRAKHKKAAICCCDAQHFTAVQERDADRSQFEALVSVAVAELEGQRRDELGHAREVEASRQLRGSFSSIIIERKLQE